jgi:adenosine deaminase/adenosine deaminase CECR1
MTFNIELLRHFAYLLALFISCSYAAESQESKSQANYQLTETHYQSLIEQPTPSLVELQAFIHDLPKGGDIHHHYVGAIYAETYLDWVEQKGFCIHRTNFHIETQATRLNGDAAQACISAPVVRADTQFYRQLLQRWSDKDFDNRLPSDLQFFSTFAYFLPVQNAFDQVGLNLLKVRAQDEGLQYIETTFKLAPARITQESDRNLNFFKAQQEQDINQVLESLFQEFQNDPAFQYAITEYVKDIDDKFSQINDASFTIKAQAYALRNEQPDSVFARLYASFLASQKSNNIVGVNIVGPENESVSMRDYTLHMKMARFLKQRFPTTKLSFHAGELSLGMVPPEGLRTHITEAVQIAEVDRIGHGLDIVYERNFNQLIQEMKQKKIAVEITLTSNEFITKVAAHSHPIILYAKNGVPIVISSDDEGVSRGTISQEYLLYLSRYKPSYSTLKKTIYNSIEYSFLSPQEKAEQIKLLNTKFARFEAEIATR